MTWCDCILNHLHYLDYSRRINSFADSVEDEKIGKERSRLLLVANKGYANIKDSHSFGIMLDSS